LNARVQLSGVDGAALRYRALAMPAGRVSMQMTLASQGRSASALTGALSGSGTVTLESAGIAGLDPRAFDTAIRASDNGQATDDIRLRQIVEPVLSAGALSVKSAQIPFNIRDGRLRVGATTLDAEGARAIISGGYDIPADQADIRAVLASTAAGQAASRPEIQLFAVGSPDALDRTIDVAALSSWLAVRAIDRETRRLDSIERGEPPPGFRHHRSRRLPPQRRSRPLQINRFPRCRLPAAIRAGLRRRQKLALRVRRLRRQVPVRLLSASRLRRCRRRSRSAPFPVRQLRGRRSRSRRSS
jgi:large subunit ribosomal protein L24